MRFSETFTALIESIGVKIPAELEPKIELISKHVADLIDKKRRRQSTSTEHVTTLKYVDPYTHENRSVAIEVAYDANKINKASYSKTTDKIVFNAACENFAIKDPSHIRGVLMHELTHSIDPKIKKELMTKRIKKELENPSPNITKLKRGSQQEFDAGWAGIASRLEVLARVIGPKTIIKKIDTWLNTEDEMIERELFKYDINKLNSIWKKNPAQLEAFKTRLSKFKTHLESYVG